jgi:hypothetical protein
VTADRLLRSLLAAAIAAAALAGPAAAPARDSNAPAAAGDNWLPCDTWVMFHWLPYDERRLYRMLGMNSAEVRAWLRDDNHHTLAQLAARRGLSVREAAAHLVAPARGRVSAERFRTLRNRAVDTLTQGHLAQHVLFHYFHQPLIASRASRLFGVAPTEFRRLRLSGFSPAEIGAVHRRSPAKVAAGARRLLWYAARVGVAAGETPARQARRVYAIQRRGMRHWLHSHIRKPGPHPAWHPSAATSHMALLCFLLRG